MLRAFLLVVVWVCIASSPVRAQSLNVLATIKPLQLLVQEIGGDAVDVDLLISPTQSAHDFQLRPSDLQRVDDAAVRNCVLEPFDDLLELGGR